MPAVTVRRETPADHEAIRAVVTAAFGRPDEAALVESLRESGAYRPDCSLVAVLDDGDADEDAEDEDADDEDYGADDTDDGTTAAGDVVGHVGFSTLELDAHPDRLALVLAPLSVAPAHQRSGVGSRLVRAGLGRAAEAGAAFVFLHGDPDYYGRFGFVPAVPAGFENPLSLGDAGFQVRAVGGAELERIGGSLTYPAPFFEVP
jgi:putative acetyltransferase